MSADFDVVIVGAGAAGMMCAAQAGARGRKVVLVEHYTKLGEKIRISGGGRCNFTNRHATSANFLSRNPDFCRSALARYTPRDFVALVERHGIAYHEKTLGQLFCDESAKNIIDMLRAECERAGVQWRMPCAVKSVAKDGPQFVVRTEQGALHGASLVIATGGLTVPKIGATPFGYRIAEQFGLAIVPPKPALVPLSFDAQALARFGDLSGISIDAEVSLRGARFRESLLITHRGLSGPAILQISSYWQDGPASEPIHIDLLPGFDTVAWLRERRRERLTLAALLAERLPRRFAQQWCEANELLKPVNQYVDKDLERIARELHDWPVRPSGTLGYNKAEVTLGGVDTRELSSKTMAATKVPALP